MRSVYIETTIPSFYHETRSDPQILLWRKMTREWWDHHRSGYSLFSSEFVLREISDTPSPKKSEALKMVKSLKQLPEASEIQDVVEYYIEHKLMPADAFGDAAHLAIASLNGMEFLLTWNCQHLANANKLRHIGVLNGRLGLATPIITTPMMLLAESS
jgi:hypothetical protein